MAIETGLAWLLAVDTAESDATPTWVTIGDQTDGTFEITRSDVDVTSKDNAGWEDSISTRKGWSATAEGRSDQDDVALLYLMDTVGQAGAAEHPVHVKLTNADGDTWIGWATLESLSLSFPEADVVGYSISLKGRKYSSALAVTRA